MNLPWHPFISSLDSSRDIIIADKVNENSMIFCAEHFITVAMQAIHSKGVFSVALSGGTTPKQLFTILSSEAYKDRINWSYVQLFWSDERCVPISDPESNYKMAMDAGLSQLNIPPNQIFRMPADNNTLEDLEKSAISYEELIIKHVPEGRFDMVMLGMGEDGHTASLFPNTHGLSVQERLVIANFIPQKNTWRMTLTYPCINKAHHIVIYVFGLGKANMVGKILNLNHPLSLPIQHIGTPTNKSLWILDKDSASDLK